MLFRTRKSSKNNKRKQAEADVGVEAEVGVEVEVGVRVGVVRVGVHLFSKM